MLGTYHQSGSPLPVCERCDHESTGVAQVLVAVGQEGVDHAGHHVVILPVVAHLTQPLKVNLAGHIWAWHSRAQVTHTQTDTQTHRCQIMARRVLACWACPPSTKWPMSVCVCVCVCVCACSVCVCMQCVCVCVCVCVYVCVHVHACVCVCTSSSLISTSLASTSLACTSSTTSAPRVVRFCLFSFPRTRLTILSIWSLFCCK